MAEIIDQHPQVMELAKQAFAKVGVTPKIEPIRGGTDGARLSFMGLPCPNLGTGGYNCHGRYECITTEAMDKCCEILISIVKLLEQKKAE